MSSFGRVRVRVGWEAALLGFFLIRDARFKPVFVVVLLPRRFVPTWAANTSLFHLCIVGYGISNAAATLEISKLIGGERSLTAIWRMWAGWLIWFASYRSFLNVDTPAPCRAGKSVSYACGLRALGYERLVTIV